MELIDLNWWCVPQLVYMFGVWFFVRRRFRQDVMRRNELILQYGTADFSKIMDQIMGEARAQMVVGQKRGPAKKRVRIWTV